MILLQASRHKRLSGFTLIELILVVSIGLILFTLTTPSAIRFYQNQVIRDVAQTVKGTLWRAKMSAAVMQNDSAFGVKILPTSLVLFQGSSYAGRVPAEDQIISIDGSVSVTGSSSEIVFSKLYATSSASGTWAISGSGLSQTLTIFNSGMIQ